MFFSNDKTKCKRIIRQTSEILLLTNNIFVHGEREVDVCQVIVRHKAEFGWNKTLAVCSRDFPLKSNMFCTIAILENKNNANGLHRKTFIISFSLCLIYLSIYSFVCVLSFGPSTYI